MYCYGQFKLLKTLLVGSLLRTADKIEYLIRVLALNILDFTSVNAEERHKPS